MMPKLTAVGSVLNSAIGSPHIQTALASMPMSTVPEAQTGFLLMSSSFAYPFFLL